MRESKYLPRLVAGETIAEPVVLVAAHPDDEIIGCGTRLRCFENLMLVHVTDGAPRDLKNARASGFGTAEEYAAARRRELDEALSVAGVAPVSTVALGVRDQEAAHRLADLVQRLTGVMSQTHPVLILTHPYEGGHPDHDACAFAVHMAAREAAPAAELAEFTSCHAASGGMRTGVFLPSDERVYTALLSEPEEAHRRLMLMCLATQQKTIAAFATDVEQFRLAPEYDFTLPPHPGTLHYEKHPWGMHGERFCELARETLAKLTVGAAV